MRNWKKARLGELIDIKHGFAFRGEFFSSNGPGDILMTPGNFAIGGGFQWGKRKYYSGPVPTEYVLRSGDLVVTMTDLSKEADTLGYSAVVPSCDERLLHNQRIGKVVRRSDDVDLRFLYWVMRSKAYRDEVLASATGSTVKHTSPTKILAFQFLLPPLHEQRAIGSVLCALENKIHCNRRMNETLEAMARSIFKDWFIDFGPTRAKTEGRAPYLAPEIWALFPDFLDDEERPQGWTSSTIGEEVDVIGGSTPSTKEPEYWNGDIAWATPKDLSSLRSPVLLATERQITDLGLSQIGSGLLPIGTVLLSSRAPIGYMAIAQVPTAINQGFIAMICRKRLSNVFVWLWTRANMDRVLQNANGSTFQEISKTNFRPIAVTVAGHDILRAFDETVNPLFERVVTNEKEINSLATIRDLLLPKLMSGAIRVKDGQKIAEAAL
ncbi:restriction endonuclease subunit S [Bradyrhizobium neotropicale]|uniref:restriction endonuclease subunit S n=1 Tax=Bradyrhizobium neotropicale TaxID=1497615 RepID=UPI001AD68C86|nr:restriction endonuclease subunit S [Bradyrhizobium neotropicale]MBO4221924.1 restriction endonuclease subunit S [Bradyrhizobium neotropicale]